MKNILDHLLSSGKDMATKTKGLAESTLGIPAAGEGRDAERSRIETHLHTIELGSDAKKLIEQELRDPLTVEQLASRVDSPAAASEVYLLSSLVVDDRDPGEQQYLDRLAAALKLPEDLVARLTEASKF
jgi:uncharacterized membrane protein YebE (DUF533 family)